MAITIYIQMESWQEKILGGNNLTHPSHQPTPSYKIMTGSVVTYYTNPQKMN